MATKKPTAAPNYADILDAASKKAAAERNLTKSAEIRELAERWNQGDQTVLAEIEKLET